jgi:hypothetical protein
MAGAGINPKKALDRVKGNSPQTTAVHSTDGKTHIVGIGNLRVIICHESDAWFAQGLEIDYAASGHSVEEVKKNFEKGLKGTIDLNIKMHCDIEHFLKVAPQNVWRELHRKGNHYRFSHVSLHDDISKTLGYQGIDYLVEPPCPEMAA